MDTTLTITKEKIQGQSHITVFHLSGWLDSQIEERLLAEAREAYNNGERFLLRDLANVEALTSAGMRAIQKIYKLLTPVEDQYKVAHVKLCNAPTQIHQILGVTGFLQNIPNFDSIQDALASFNE